MVNLHRSIIFSVAKPKGQFSCNDERVNAHDIQRYKEWYQQLPKVLWEVGGADPMLTEVKLFLVAYLRLRECTDYFTVDPSYITTSDSNV
jgi:hypothetical protein